MRLARVPCSLKVHCAVACLPCCALGSPSAALALAVKPWMPAPYGSLDKFERYTSHHGAGFCAWWNLLRNRHRGVACPTGVTEPAVPNMTAAALAARQGPRLRSASCAAQAASPCQQQLDGLATHRGAHERLRRVDEIAARAMYLSRDRTCEAIARRVGVARTPHGVDQFRK